MRSLALSAIARRKASGGSLAALRGLERLGRDPRGDLARLGAAHAVGDREQRRAGEVGVLVRGPLAARCRSGRPARRRAAPSAVSGDLQLEAELGVADLDLVEVGELGLALRAGRR